MDQIDVYGSLFWGLVFLGVGAVGLVLANKHLRYATESPGWPRVDAEVTELAIRMISGRNRTTYSPVVSYMFQHDGRWITGERISFFQGAFSRREEAEDVLALYAHGTRVPVSVAPHDPEISVIETGASRSHHIPRILAIGLIVVGAGFLASAGLAILGAR